ncbi:beta-ketoacyl synthase N-terminal-like domain-containing protein [Kineosporia succinea]|uniref:3-oxoacyl-[acyl-carrier-protein] synthase II n=1 Tax=Kineosporia succinea TaxID=84632 RepID=A0ABT9P790_9ACTN|nr:beta-ketoacyl synthase N-terminal-like domain-containing protein [Kineosporia succinea]MDP9828421.1 3-oxoacyl-[acyl-carrier-protein] synthase II [Kineosporia succinea]
MTTVISGCGVVSPAGTGLTALADLIASGEPGHAVPFAPDAGQLPDVAIRTVGDLRVADHVGRKGTRRLDRMVGFGLVAARLAADAAPGGVGADQVGVVVGTSTGSVRSIVELSAAAGGEAAYVPSRFPNAVMNSCAGQIAVRNGYRAVNATLATGHASSPAALRWGLNALRTGQADRVLAGGVEELSPHLLWGWRASGTLEPGAVLGEGCALLVLERHPDGESGGSGTVLAEVTAAEVGFAPSVRTSSTIGLTDALSRCAERALRGIDPMRVGLVSLGAGSQLGTRSAELEAVRRVLGEASSPQLIRVSDVIGDCYSASGAMQVAAVLAIWGRVGEASLPVAPFALVTSVGLDGNVGAVLLRRPA